MLTIYESNYIYFCHYYYYYIFTIGLSSNIINLNSPSSGTWKVTDDNNLSSTKSSKRKLNFDSMLQKVNRDRNSNHRVSQSPKHFGKIELTFANLYESKKVSLY